MNSPAHVLSTHPAPERSSVRRLRLLAGRLLAWGLCALAPALAAQTAALEAPPAAAPARVPYLLHLDGAASVSGPGSPTLWRGIELGRPLSGGERFWLSAGARAEFLVGSGSSLRLLGEARLDVSRLDDRTLQMALTDGPWPEVKDSFAMSFYGEEPRPGQILEYVGFTGRRHLDEFDYTAFLNRPPGSTGSLEV